MIGHRTPRYEAFGWAAARLDDLVNWPAARIAAGLIIAAAYVTRGVDPVASRRAVARDAKNHASPNACWPEAAMAGALGLKLSGRDEQRDASTADIRRALSLYRRALILQWIALLALTILIAFAVAD